MDDNATCHRTLSVQDCLDSEGIQRLAWPARSPDLNPIENVGCFGRQVAGRNYPPTNKNTLIRALTEEWDKLHQQLLDNVVQSMFPFGKQELRHFSTYFQVKEDSADFTGEIVFPERKLSYRNFVKCQSLKWLRKGPFSKRLTNMIRKSEARRKVEIQPGRGQKCVAAQVEDAVATLMEEYRSQTIGSTSVRGIAASVEQPRSTIHKIL
ncbi:uncharacterized protein TNCV_3581101 [Trichonephila clavipes]|nr:uncharacterized protein TNCV_3581101 [Trichonephila clavipes]